MDVRSGCVSEADVVEAWGRASGEDGIERFRYTMAGWGAGELHLRGDIVLAHDLLSQTSTHDLPAAVDVTAPVAVRGDSARRDRGPAPLRGGERPPESTLPATDRRIPSGFVPNLIGRIRAQLAGAETGYDDVPIDLSWCTPFQASLAATLRAVPWGEVVTYGELAALAGRPGAARAAGSFCAQNRFWLLVPCHRVVAADGIGGYGDAGTRLKRRLLALEGVEL